ncbi:MAG: type II toxin-antitoxin system RelE/ParE family toxin [Thermoanaerobaculales bacterium]|nr:type II toxin-antitoxin system RelE/ParE family toxin [Thermoanaerobaculales bacterium]
MNRSLVVRRRAEVQAAVARDWYDDQLEGLGDQFLDELEAAMVRARDNPLHYQRTHLEIRRVLLRRFPYSLFFVAEDDRVVVLAVLRQSENPAKWRT